jgi:hypothetical protein
MAERKSFLIRIDEDLLTQLKRWADDDLRSLNGQIEFLLRRCLRESGRNRGNDGNLDNPPGVESDTV